VGITVFVVPEAKNFQETYDTIMSIGLIVNQKEKAATIIKKMESEVKEIQKKVAKVADGRSAFIETSDEPEIYTAGKGSFIQEMFDLLDIKNVATKEDWYQISSEAIIKANPDVILVMYDYVPNIVEKVKKRQGFQTIPAVSNDRVVQIDSDKISRTGPRLAEGLEEIAKAVYPEAFQ
ncbi:MAG: ABC transporter substrate-binding protein, partial [Kurthia sp.]